MIWKSVLDLRVIVAIIKSFMLLENKILWSMHFNVFQYLDFLYMLGESLSSMTFQVMHVLSPQVSQNDRALLVKTCFNNMIEECFMLSMETSSHCSCHALAEIEIASLQVSAKGYLSKSFSCGLWYVLA